MDQLTDLFWATLLALRLKKDHKLDNVAEVDLTGCLHLTDHGMHWLSLCFPNLEKVRLTYSQIICLCHYVLGFRLHIWHAYSTSNDLSNDTKVNVLTLAFSVFAAARGMVFHKHMSLNFWPDCKAIPAYGLMMSVCLSVCLSVRLSVRPSVRQHFG